MMKFAVGYQQPENGEPFSAIVRDYREHLAELYFAWPGAASGRTALGAGDWSAQAELEEELREIRAMGLRLDLLFNANCYGKLALSRKFEFEIGSLIDYLDSRRLAPEIITTASPFVAAAIRRHFPAIEIRASINMRLDSTTAMGYLADLFDSFHLRRDLQRDLATVKRFHQWCADHGKTLCMLANSGCLRNCPAQTFHDNLVAHDAEIREHRNVEDFSPHLCWKLYQQPEKMVEFLRSSWIRPEELHLYEPYFPVVKLATRQHAEPRKVIGAYASGRFRGNLADLTEPCFSRAFFPWLLDNERFPPDWPETAGTCASNCHNCGKCEKTLGQVSIQYPDYVEPPPR